MQELLQNMWLFRYADEISVGDEVLVKQKDNFTAAKVNNVSDIMMQGHYCYLIQFLC